MTTKAENTQASLKRRIRQFYALLNAGDFHRCYRMIDPRLLQKPGTVTLLQYETALRDFLETVGAVEVQEIRIVGLHLNEPNKLYEGRDFALGKTIWVDATDKSHEFSERWVYDNSAWFTRSTGFLKPTQAGPAQTPKTKRKSTRSVP